MIDTSHFTDGLTDLFCARPCSSLAYTSITLFLNSFSRLIYFTVRVTWTFFLRNTFSVVQKLIFWAMTSIDTGIITFESSLLTGSWACRATLLVDKGRLTGQWTTSLISPFNVLVVSITLSEVLLSGRTEIVFTSAEIIDTHFDPWLWIKKHVTFLELK